MTTAGRWTDGRNHASNPAMVPAFVLLIVLMAAPGAARGQTPAPQPDPALTERAVGAWELSNPAGSRKCAVTLKAEFEHAGVLDEVGGTAYLAQLLTAMVGIINAGEYGRTVHDAWLRRQLIDIGENVVNNAFGGGADGLAGNEQIESAEQALFELATDGTASSGFVTFERALTDAILGAERAFRRAGAVSGLTTGLRDLDSKLGGLHP